MTDKYVIKGELSDDGSFIKYINEDKDELEMPFAKCLENFVGKYIELTVAVKLNQDLCADSIELTIAVKMNQDLCEDSLED